MTVTHTPPRFDLARFARAIEEHDAAGQSSYYALDAELTIVDRDHPPSLPLVLRGREQIAAHLTGVAERDMTHEVRHLVRGGDRASMTIACRYADGTRVLCMAALDLSGGLIARQTTVQAWDA